MLCCLSANNPAIVLETDVFLNEISFILKKESGLSSLVNGESSEWVVVALSNSAPQIGWTLEVINVTHFPIMV